MDNAITAVVDFLINTLMVDCPSLLYLSLVVFNMGYGFDNITGQTVNYTID